MARGLMCVVLAMGFANALPAAANPLYRCSGGSGEVLFTDLPCPGGTQQALRSTTTIELAKPSADERAVLDGLNHEARLERRVQTHPTPTAAQPTRHERRCAAAQTGLDRVRATKRRGYRASSAAALDARERADQMQYDRDCVGRSR